MIKTIYVSLDAARKDTFERLRRGANFETVMKNLEFISRLRKNGEFQNFGILFVVQACNFREMKEFIQLGKSLRCDYVGFSQLLRNGVYAQSDEEFKKANIFSSDHPEHQEFLNLLNDIIFDDPIVDLGNLSHLRRFKNTHG